ncbi:MAG: hypothetical protein ACI4TY_04125 [Candidatus Limosilactobacillus intestinavium]
MNVAYLGSDFRLMKYIVTIIIIIPKNANVFIGELLPKKKSA